jgi:ribosomal protein S27E
MSIKTLRPATKEDLRALLDGHDYYLKYTLAANGEFTEGQCYDGHAAFSLSCARCGVQEFHVGVGSHITLIKCVTCNDIIYTHDG